MCGGSLSEKENKLFFFIDFVKRTDSIQSRRKVSSLSDRSDTSEPGAASGGEESPGILSDDQPPESPSDSNDTDETVKNMPWMRAALELLNSFNYYCTHQNYCHPYCYRRHIRAASRLIKAVRKVNISLTNFIKFRQKLYYTVRYYPVS